MNGSVIFVRSFSGIGAVKVQALEAYFEGKIGAVRIKQLSLLKKYLLPTLCYFTAINQTIPGVTALMSFSAYTFAGNPLEPAQTFAALALFNMLYTPAFKITLVANIVPSLKRIQTYMTQPEITITQHSPSKTLFVALSKGLPAFAVKIKHNVFTWPQTRLDGELESEPSVSSFKLTIRDLAILQGSLVLVIGPNGGGKSSFLSALLGQMQSQQPFSLGSTIAYCQQEPWIQAGTVRSNVLMQRPYKASLFTTALETTSLKHDIRQLPRSISEKGANLSGGQKSRIALARAVYSEAEVILLDDVLASLDTIVANKVFAECIRGAFAAKTVFLVTQRLQFVHAADVVLFVDADGVVLQGSFHVLRSNEVVDKFVENLVINEEVTKEAPDFEATTLAERVVNVTDAKAGNYTKANDANDSNMLEEEERNVGEVSADAYKAYIRHAGGNAFIAPLVFSVVATLAARALIGVWLAWWSIDKLIGYVSQLGYLAIYAVFTIVQISLTGSISYIMVLKSLNASKSMHNAVLDALLRAPLAFFQSQPIGRVLSRFNRDIQVVDGDLMNAIDALLISAGGIGGCLLSIVVSSPLLIALLVPILALSYWAQRDYKRVALYLRRLLAVLASPVSAFFSETLAGISTVQAHGLQDKFLQENASHINAQTRGEMYRIFLDSWVVMRLQVIFAPFTLLIGVLAAAEVNMNSVERLCHYIDSIPAESTPILAQKVTEATSLLAYVGNDLGSVPDTWLEKGHIDFRQVTVTFQKRQNPVLKSIDLAIQAGEHVGIVGRTGSGKSTLVSCFSRLVDVSSGQIVIDGLDISRVPLKHLRQQVVVMPQEAVLFKGTLRENLDPYGRYEDSQMWAALEHCGMRAYYESRGRGLDELIEAHGDNLSAGMRQLLAATRALLAKPKILIVDEATAAMDPQSEQLLRNLLETRFRSTTILCIAHRVESLVRMNRIIVLADGRVVASGSPRLILPDPASEFYKLVAVEGQERPGASCSRRKKENLETS
ncbi:hypothetical protein HDU86_001821 [Geranomyces michiganensis]|nr:hypothetical protein HDU86_001821 [Geranomyces michiganensis]